MHVPDAELSIIETAMAEAPHGWRGEERVVDPLPALGREAVEISVKYKNYLDRQEKEVCRSCCAESA